MIYVDLLNNHNYHQKNTNQEEKILLNKRLGKKMFILNIIYKTKDYVKMFILDITQDTNIFLLFFK